MAPDDILRVAENYPEILNHYDLEQFKEIGKADTPWIEKYPCLVPYTYWDFSYAYWDALLTRLSSWQNDGKRPRVDAFATTTANSSNRRSHVKKHGSIKRPLPENPKEKNLRNSIDSIMEYRYWCDLNNPFDPIVSIPLRIRNIIMDKNLTYEQLMIKMSMMSEEDCGMIFYGLFIANNEEFLKRMLEDDIALTIRQVPAEVLLPLTIMYSSANLLYSLMVDLMSQDDNAIRNFRDKGGNNAWHYFFFRNPLYHPSQNSKLDKLEHEIYDFLTDFACSPDTPNDMGFSYDQINQSMKQYLRAEEQ